jgi:hypothetical protein
VAPFGSDALARYRHLCRVTVALAAGRGAIDADRVRQLSTLLADDEYVAAGPPVDPPVLRGADAL